MGSLVGFLSITSQESDPLFQSFPELPIPWRDMAGIFFRIWNMYLIHGGYKNRGQLEILAFCKGTFKETHGNSRENIGNPDVLLLQGNQP